MTEAATIAADLLPVQMELYRATEREVLLSGGWGSAKSRGLCYALLKHALIRNNTTVLARKTLTDLKMTTLRTLLEPDGDLPPVLPPDTYEHNKADGVIRIVGGGTIYYFGFGTGETEISARKARSLNLGAVALDQAEEFTENEYLTLSRRLRNPVDPAPQIIAVCNPAGPNHFLYHWFHIGDPENRPPDRRVIYAKASGNWFLPKAYVASLKGLPPIYYARYVQGQWVAFEGAVYPDWSPERHVARYEGSADATDVRVLAGVDPGFTNPFCVEVAVEDGQGLHFVDEAYETGLVEPAQVALCVRMARKWGVEEFLVDPEAPGLVASLRSEGLYARPAANAVLKGIGKVQRRMAENRFLVDPRCKMLVQQVPGYAWKKDRDEPVKADDHACDAARYVVATIDPDYRDTSEEEAPVSARVADLREQREAQLEREREEKENPTPSLLVRAFAEGTEELHRSEDWLTVDNDALFR